MSDPAVKPEPGVVQYEEMMQRIARAKQIHDYQDAVKCTCCPVHGHGQKIGGYRR